MQFKGGPPPVGVMFDTALTRSEHVLALAVLYKLQAAREARAASVSVSTPELRTAVFCDALVRFLSGAGTRNPAPIGVPASLKQTSTNRMADAVLAERGEDGEPRYPFGITKVNDTADVAALIRNGISAQQPDNGVVVIAGPLSNLAAALALPDLKVLAPNRVRSLVIAAIPDDLRADLVAARKVLAEWPTPIFLIDTPQLAYPAADLESRFAWSPNHPVPAAYRAFQKMPYDAPLQSAAAVYFAVHPESPLFASSSPGTLQLADNGSIRIAASSAGKHKTVQIAAGQQAAALEQLSERVSSQPPQPAPGRGRGKQEE